MSEDHVVDRPNGILAKYSFFKALAAQCVSEAAAGSLADVSPINTTSITIFPTVLNSRFSRLKSAFYVLELDHFESDEEEHDNPEAFSRFQKGIAMELVCFNCTFLKAHNPDNCSDISANLWE